MPPRVTRSSTNPAPEVADVPEVKTVKELAAEKRAAKKVLAEQRKAEKVAAFEAKAAAKDAEKMAAAQVTRRRPKPKPLKRQGAMLDVTEQPNPGRNIGTAAPEVCSV